MKTHYFIRTNLSVEASSEGEALRILNENLNEMLGDYKARKIKLYGSRISRLASVTNNAIKCPEVLTTS